MPYRRGHRKFGREKNARRALLKGLAQELIVHSRITTTQARAKAVRPVVERAIARAARGGLGAVRLLRKDFTPMATKRIVFEVGARYRDRRGGYTRITRLPLDPRSGARMAVIELV